MKQITLLALMLGMDVGAFAQTEQEPCCGIVGINPATNTITGWNRTTGRLFQFKVNAADIKTVKLNNTVNATVQLDRITNLNGTARNYTVLKYFAEPVGKPVINNAEPVGVKIKSTTAEPVGKTNINYAEPVGLTNLQIDNAAPCCSVIDIQIDNAEPVGVVTARNKTTGKNIQFKAPALVLKAVNTGDPAYIEPCCNMAIVMVNTGAETQAYGYHMTSEDGNSSSSDKWVITPIATMKGVLGGLDINFPTDVDRDILIYQPADNKFITSVSKNAKSYTIAPGEYRFTITNVPIDKVPIKKGHVTRLKVGYLNIVSEGDWHLYDDIKEKAFTSGNKPKRIALPIGSYQLKLGQEFYPLLIKDGKTVEY